MFLERAQIAQFEKEGHLLLGSRLTGRAMDRIDSEVRALSPDRSSSTYESDDSTVRALHGCHAGNAVFGALVRLPLILQPARELLNGEVYVYQFKINLKAAFSGEAWPWHQDFSFWALEDGMLEPRALTAAVFIDDVTEFNGPLYFIPGSHQLGSLQDGDRGSGVEDGWRRDFGRDLRYATRKEQVKELASRQGIVAAHGQRGSVVLFHSNIVHGSPSNISPAPRRIVFITYNSVANVPLRLVRPEFLVGRDNRMLTALEQNELPESGCD